MKKIIALVLVVILTTLTLSSCETISNAFDLGGLDTRSGIPVWYTGGFEGIHNGMGAEYYWVETYEEMQEALSLLKSHGSTIQDSVIFTHDGEMFDTKYCFTVMTYGSKRIKWGENPFDRKCSRVTIRSIAFLEDVTIDWITTHYVKSCYAYSIYGNFDLKSNPDVDFKSLPREIDTKSPSIMRVTLGEDQWLEISAYKSGDPKAMPDDCLDALLESIEYIISE